MMAMYVAFGLPLALMLLLGAYGLLRLSGSDPERADAARSGDGNASQTKISARRSNTAWMAMTVVLVVVASAAGFVAKALVG